MPLKSAFVSENKHRGNHLFSFIRDFKKITERMLTVKNGCLEFCKTRFSVRVCATSSCRTTQIVKNYVTIQFYLLKTTFDRRINKTAFLNVLENEAEHLKATLYNTGKKNVESFQTASRKIINLERAI